MNCNQPKKIIHGIFSCVVGEETDNHIFFNSLDELKNEMFSLLELIFDDKSELSEVFDENNKLFDEIKIKSNEDPQMTVDLLNSNLKDIGCFSVLDPSGFKTVNFDEKYVLNGRSFRLLSHKDTFKKDYVLEFCDEIPENSEYLDIKKCKIECSEDTY